jgi:hypothetical protein
MKTLLRALITAALLLGSLHSNRTAKAFTVKDDPRLNQLAAHTNGGVCGGEANRFASSLW